MLRENHRSPLARTTMLVVDDSAAMREVFKIILEGLGVGEVLLARSGPEALRILKRREPDVIFVDWRMPAMNGLDFVRHLRTAPDSPCRFVPIVMCTGHTEAAHVVEARDTGITEFLAKPVSANAVAQRIEEIIRRPRDFVRASRFFGPDRRRLTRGFSGSGKRLVDEVAPAPAVVVTHE
jgi:two-component system chemotaxis response regulator CheY